MSGRRHLPATLRLAAAAVVAAAVAGTPGSAFGQRYRAVILPIPEGFDSGIATASCGGKQIGYAFRGADDGQPRDSHAILWSGYASGAPAISAPAYPAGITSGTLSPGPGRPGLSGRMIDLHPAGYACSFGLALSRDHQVGCVQVGALAPGAGRAFAWAGTAASGFRLSQASALYSQATAIDGADVYGVVDGHAAKWAGVSPSTAPVLLPERRSLGSTSSSKVNAAEGGRAFGYSDLSAPPFSVGHPGRGCVWTGSTLDQVAGAGWIEPTPRAGLGTQIVGEGLRLRSSTAMGSYHAFLADGTTSLTDLHPTGCTASSACGISSGRQAGYVDIPGTGTFTDLLPHRHAVVWASSPDRYVDLHQYLPEGYDKSEALGMDEAGNVVGKAHQTTPGPARWRAVLWVAEPAQLGSIGPNPETGTASGASASFVLDLDGLAPPAGAVIRVRSSHADGTKPLPWRELTIPDGQQGIALKRAWPLTGALITAIYGGVTKTWLADSPAPPQPAVVRYVPRARIGF